MISNRTKKDELFSSVIHEIRNSLNPVINLSSILKRNSGDKLTFDENSYLEIIERNGKKIFNIIEEFSFYGRLTDENLPHSFFSVTVREVVDNIFTAITGTDNSGFKLACDIDETSSSISTDYEIFHRIIKNIFIFFISSDSGQKSLYLRSDVIQQDLNLIISRKRNEFPVKMVTEFDNKRFIEEGFSAGLVVWLQFASLYIYILNGTLYYSHDNHGEIIFLLKIPLDRKLIGKDINRQISDDDSVYNPARNFVILVIDDDIDNIIPIQAIIENEFKGAGKLYHAENGTAGLDMLEKVKPDIILLDLTLPDISGFSLVRNIKNLFLKKDIPVIAFTAIDVAENKEKMFKSGFDDIISKPFNIDTFIQTINRWII